MVRVLNFKPQTRRLNAGSLGGLTMKKFITTITDLMNKTDLRIIPFIIFFILTVTSCDLFNNDDKALFEWTEVTGLEDQQIMALEISNENIIAGTYFDGIYFKTKEEEWQQSNLKGIEIRDIISHPSGKLLAATFGEGIWISENNGETWSQATNGPDSRGRLLDFAITPSGRVLAGVFGSDDFNDESDIYYSDDEGVSWAGTNLKDAFAIWSVASGDGENGLQYSGTMQTIFKSSDDGKNWEIKEIPEEIDGQEWMGITVTKTGTVLAVGNGIIRSSDEGNSWDLVYDNSRGFLPIISIEDEQYAGGTRGTFDGSGEGVLRSKDDGKTWEVLNNGLTNTEILSLTYSDNKLYAGTSGGVFVCNIK